MLRKVSLFATLALIVSACSQAPADVVAPVLAPQFGTSAVDTGEDVAVDPAGQVYVVGVTDGDLARPNLGEGDAFIRRYARGDRAKVVWQRQFGTEKSDTAFGVATAPGGAVYVVGRTSGSLAADNPKFSENAFIRKYTRGGKVVWTRQFGGTGSQTARTVSVDAHGAVYVAGETYGDIFARKYTATGTLVWQRVFGVEPDRDSVGGISVTEGGVFLAGTTSSFSGNRERFAGFLRKLNSNGDEQWTRTINLNGDEFVRDVAVGDGVYVTGSVTIKGGDFSGEDVFLRKYDERGRVLWTRQFGSEASDSGESVSVDPSGNVYLAGSTQGVLADFNSGSFDAFARKYTNGGGLVWTQQYQVSTYDYDYAYAVAALSEDEIYLTGFTFGETGEFNAFVSKLDYSGELVWKD